MGVSEYRVLTKKDSTLGGKLDAEAIERRLDEHAADGWRLVNGFNVANLKTFGGQVVLVLERET